ncbi:hypothetical protein DFH09DRAFT_926905, partial [Mycena vulgaris]
SPRNSQRVKKEVKPDPVPESQWRSLLLTPLRTRINRTAIKSLYRLSASSFEALKYTAEEMLMNGQSPPMFLYQEREVERIVWIKHGGGPSAFEAHLKKLHERHKESKHSGKPFQQQRTYGPRYRAGTSATRAPSPAQPLKDWRAPTRSLIAAKDQLKQVNQLWLWDAANKDLSAARTYPPRPDALRPASASFTHLREVLGRGALETSQWTYIYQGDETKYWEDRYLDELFAALMAVIEKHGLGEQGWKSARWEVYDKVSPVTSHSLGRMQADPGASIPSASRDCGLTAITLATMMRRIG